MEFYCDKDRPVVATNHGKIRGYFYQGVYHFKGISYAKAERFCPPEDVEDWKGVKDALNYGNVCLQSVEMETLWRLTGYGFRMKIARTLIYGRRR